MHWVKREGEHMPHGLCVFDSWVWVSAMLLSAVAVTAVVGSVS